MPENPAWSLLYAGAIYKNYKDRAANVVSETKAEFATENDRRQILSEVVRYMYNGGSSAIRILFKNFVRDHGARNLSYDSFQKAFQKYARESYGEGVSVFQNWSEEKLEAKRIELSEYCSRMAEDLQTAVGKKKECGV